MQSGFIQLLRLPCVPSTLLQLWYLSTASPSPSLPQHHTPFAPGCPLPGPAAGAHKAKGLVVTSCHLPTQQTLPQCCANSFGGCPQAQCHTIYCTVAAFWRPDKFSWNQIRVQRLWRRKKELTWLSFHKHDSYTQPWFPWKTTLNITNMSLCHCCKAKFWKHVSGIWNQDKYWHQGAGKFNTIKKKKKEKAPDGIVQLWKLW